jgi:hypothetical protein
MNSSMKLVVGMVAGLQQIAQDYPSATPHVNEAVQAMRKIGLEIMKSQPIGEPMAPPTGG